MTIYDYEITNIQVYLILEEHMVSRSLIAGSGTGINITLITGYVLVLFAEFRMIRTLAHVAQCKQTKMNFARI